jgi:hypothetical protein
MARRRQSLWIGGSGNERARQLRQSLHNGVRTHPQCNRGMLTSYPRGHFPCMRHQPGIGSRPRCREKGALFRIKVSQNEIELVLPRRYQNQAFARRSPLEFQDTLHGVAIGWIGTQAPNTLCRISNHAAPGDFPRGKIYARVSAIGRIQTAIIRMRVTTIR